MRIAYHCNIDLSRGGGATIHVREVVAGLRRLGHEVTLVAPHAPHSHVRPDVVLPAWATGGGARVRADWGALSALQALSRSWRPDVWYFRSQSLSLLPFMTKWVLGGTRILEVNNDLRQELALAGTGHSKNALACLCEWSSLRSSDTVVAVAAPIRDILCRRYGLRQSKVAMVMNGTNTQVFRPMPKTEVRARLGLPADVPIVGYVGSMFPFHWVADLLRAAPCIRSARADAVFVLVGGGPCLAQLQALASEAGLGRVVRFTGRVPMDTAAEYINAFDVAVVTYDPEIPGPGMKVLDYMSCARPVVAGGPSELTQLVASSDAGMVVEPGDARQLADAVLTLLSDPALADRLGRNGRAAVLAQYTWERTVREIEAVCLEAVEVKRTGRARGRA
jgi:glycosyltransferase involved in cell wall biosynthesis